MSNNIHSFKTSLLSTSVDKKYFSSSSVHLKKNKKLKYNKFPAYTNLLPISNDQKNSLILDEKKKMKYKKLPIPLPLIMPMPKNLINIKKDARGLDGAPAVDWPVSAKSLKKGSIQVVIQGGSTIDFILEKSSCEMSDFFD